MSTKFFKISIKIKNCETIFDERLDPGVIISQHYTFTGTDKRFSSPIFAMTLNGYGQLLLDDVIEIKYEEL